MTKGLPDKRGSAGARLRSTDLTGTWLVQNPDRGDKLPDGSARLLVGGVYEITSGDNFQAALQFRDREGATQEATHYGKVLPWGTGQILFLDEEGHRETFLVDADCLRRVLTTRDTWELECRLVRSAPLNSAPCQETVFHESEIARLNARAHDTAVVDDARAAFDASSSLTPAVGQPPHGRRWQGLAARARAFISGCRRPIEVIQNGQRAEYGFEGRRKRAWVAATAPYLEEMLAIEYARFVNHLREFGDSPLADPSGSWPFGDRIVSFPLYTHMRFVLTCLSHLPPPRIVCEIGGGTGNPARLWASNPIHRPAHYFIVDLPEALFFSHIYLATHFGRERVRYHQGREAINPATLVQNGFTLVPVQKIECLSPLYLDLVINTLSMQEMTDEWIDYYMDWLDRQPLRYFYSLNYFAQPLCAMQEGQNSWSPRPAPRFVARLLAFNSQRSARNFAEALYERLPEPLPARPEVFADLMTRALTGQTWLEALDWVRRSGDSGAMLTLLRRGQGELGFVPKELWHLAFQLASDMQDPIYQANSKEIDTACAQLGNLRRDSAEGSY